MKTIKIFITKHKDLFRSVVSVLSACAVMASVLLPYRALMTWGKDENVNEGLPASLYVTCPVGIAYEPRRQLLAKFIFSLAPNEPYVCQVAIGATVMNRKNNVRFHSDIASVIFNFYPYFKKEFLLAEPSERSMRAARDALLGVDPSGGALYFCSKGNEGELSSPYHTITASYGNYHFAK